MLNTLLSVFRKEENHVHTILFVEDGEIVRKEIKGVPQVKSPFRDLLIERNRIGIILALISGVVIRLLK